jgi:hypothetical protein
MREKDRQKECIKHKRGRERKEGRKTVRKEIKEK